MTTTSAAGGDRAFFGHPKALGYLAFTEAWERFSYYGMQSLLVLYMTKTLLLSPHVDQIVGFDAFQAVIQAVYNPGVSVQKLSSAICAGPTPSRCSTWASTPASSQPR